MLVPTSSVVARLPQASVATAILFLGGPFPKSARISLSRSVEIVLERTINFAGDLLRPHQRGNTLRWPFGFGQVGCLFC